MNFKSELLKEHSKSNSIAIGNFILENPSNLNELIFIFLSGANVYSQRASMVISYVYDSKPKLFDIYKEDIIKYLLNNDCSVAVKRCICRIMQNMEIPKKLHALTFDRCINIIIDPTETIAVRAFCMQVLYNLSEIHKELITEFRLALEKVLLSSSEAGIQNRGRKLLKKLSKIND